MAGYVNGTIRSTLRLNHWSSVETPITPHEDVLRWVKRYGPGLAEALRALDSSSEKEGPLGEVRRFRTLELPADSLSNAINGLYIYYSHIRGGAECLMTTVGTFDFAVSGLGHDAATLLMQHLPKLLHCERAFLATTYEGDAYVVMHLPEYNTAARFGILGSDKLTDSTVRVKWRLEYLDKDDFGYWAAATTYRKKPWGDDVASWKVLKMGNDDTEKLMAALTMSQHPRLGKSSQISQLPDCVLHAIQIACVATEEIESPSWSVLSGGKYDSDDDSDNDGQW